MPIQEALSIPVVPRVTLWVVAKGCALSRRTKEILEMTGLPFDIRHLEEQPPTVDELVELAAQVEGGAVALADWTRIGARFAHPGSNPRSEDLLELLRWLQTHWEMLARPIALAPALHRAMVASPPEFVLRLVAPELPRGESDGSFMRRVLQNRIH